MPNCAACWPRWADGSLSVVDEHLYTEETARVLRQAIAALPRGTRGPRILITTLPGETHALGLLMAEALFTLDGAACLSLGTETPLLDVAGAATTHGCDSIALSFSSAFPLRQVGSSLRQLRLASTGTTAIWAGGAGIAGVEPINGVTLLPTLDSGRLALAAWKDSRQMA